MDTLKNRITEIMLECTVHGHKIYEYRDEILQEITSRIKKTKGVYVFPDDREEFIEDLAIWK
jgi:hypothetical protein